jgi:hypothetical protein
VSAEKAGSGTASGGMQATAENESRGAVPWCSHSLWSRRGSEATRAGAEHGAW